ncbi:hypothetical protein FRB99_003295, partial [Tulasnella sp. 403]
ERNVQALEIDPVTLTPNVALQLGKVLRIVDGSAELKQFKKPGANGVGFGNRLMDGEEVGEEAEIISCDSNALQGWRLVPSNVLS